MKKNYIVLFYCTYSISNIKCMQIIVIALILAFLFKKPPEDDSYKTKIIVNCGQVELPKANYRSHRARVLANRPPPNSLLAADRYQIKFEEKMGVIIRDLVLYSIFLALILVTIYLMSNPDIFKQNVEFNSIFNNPLTNVKIALYVSCISVYKCSCTLLHCTNLLFLFEYIQDNNFSIYYSTFSI